jgi:hypothetical protein
MSIGPATITARDSNSGQQATVEVVVNDATLLYITMNPGNPADLPVGHTQVFATSIRTVPGGVFDDDQRRVVRGGQWSVSNDAVASIEPFESGLIARVTGLAEGNVDVVYTDYDAEGTRTGIEVSAPLTVTSNVLEDILISPDTPFSQAVDNWTPFKAYGVYSDDSFRDITDDVVWVSSDTSSGVFDIETKGRLTALDAVGSTTDASAEMVNTEDTLIRSIPLFTRVTVNADELAELVIQESGVPVEVGNTVQFTVKGQWNPSGDQNDFTERATWSVDNTAIATVSNAPGTKGQVTGVRASATPVTITATDPDTTVATSEGFYVSQP